eukprot:TRINITY_DN5238_c0_g1_i1.p2 TRINITY_DN5238_c0_g1~~TRINITY_DN5238_c0_g1_i1.p2  ORF type:complete len:102 (-),score=25.46 TRINITY_DN5238_c0_g1_i1:217-522(-)
MRRRMGASMLQQAAKIKTGSAVRGLQEANVRLILAICNPTAVKVAVAMAEALEEEGLEEEAVREVAVSVSPNKSIHMELEEHALTLHGAVWWWAAKEEDAT